MGIPTDQRSLSLRIWQADGYPPVTRDGRCFSFGARQPVGAVLALDPTPRDEHTADDLYQKPDQGSAELASLT